MARDKAEIQIRRRKKTRRIAVPGPERGFALRRRGSVSLCLPEGKRGRWADDERVFRSLAFARDGRVISTGFPKFFTYQEDGYGRVQADEALAGNEPAFATVKHDGSLAIRFVHRGEVGWRTRASLDPDHLTERFQAVSAELYPALEDAAALPGHSLLFEYVSPVQRIVIEYSKQDLILIGAVDNETLEPMDYPELQRLAHELNLHLVDCLERPSSVAELKRTVDSMTGIEGAVLRWSSGRSLLKVKNGRYESLHRARCELHPKKIYAICAERNPESLAALLRRVGVAEEDPAFDYIKELYERYLGLQRDLEAELVHLEQLAAENQGLSRKRFSRQVAQGLGSPRAEALMALRGEDRPRASELLERAWVNQRFTEPEA